MKKNVDRQKIIRRTNFKRPLQKCTLRILKIKDIRFYEKLKSSNPRQNQNNSDSPKSHIESKIPNISFEKMSKFRNEKFPRLLINAWKKENCKGVKFTRRSKARKAATLWSRSKRARRKVARNMWRRGGVSPPWERVSTHIMRAQGRTIRTRDTHAQTMARERESSNPLVCVCVCKCIHVCGDAWVTAAFEIRARPQCACTHAESQPERETRAWRIRVVHSSKSIWRI